MSDAIALCAHPFQLLWASVAECAQMSDMDSDETPDGAVEGTPRSQVTPRPAPRARRTRRITAWVLVVLASRLIPISVISVWAIRTVTNTDQYVATFARRAGAVLVFEGSRARGGHGTWSTPLVKDGLIEAEVLDSTHSP